MEQYNTEVTVNSNAENDINQNSEAHHREENFEDADENKEDPEDIQGKIFVGGLSWSTTEENLREYFEKYGELSDVALMVDKKSGKPRGFGFIKMKDPAAADLIMSNEHTIDGRVVDVKRALPRDKAPGPAKSEANKIFVGGLPQEVDDEAFGEYFRQYGPVKDAIVMVDRNSKASRGFGFITFEKEETVEDVIKVQHSIKGKSVEIKRAEPREASRGSGNSYEPNNYNSMGNHGRNGGGRGSGPVNGRYGSNGGRGYADNSAAAGYPSYMTGVRMPSYARGYPVPNYQTGYRAPYGTVPVYGYPPANTPQGVSYPAYAGGYAGYAPAAGATPPHGNVQYAGNPAASPARSTDGDSIKSGGYDPSNMSQGVSYNASAIPIRVAPYQYGAVPPPGYGYMYPAGGIPAPQQSQVQGNRGSANENRNDQNAYGAYRGQGSSQGRADRSYRPY